MYRTLILIPMLLLALNGNEEALYLNFIGFLLIFLFSMWCKYTKRGKAYFRKMYKSLSKFNDKYEQLLDKISK